MARIWARRRPIPGNQPSNKAYVEGIAPDFQFEITEPKNGNIQEGSNINDNPNNIASIIPIPPRTRQRCVENIQIRVVRKTKPVASILSKLNANNPPANSSAPNSRLRKAIQNKSACNMTDVPDTKAETDGCQNKQKIRIRIKNNQHSNANFGHKR